jgi:anti-sigma B factor antagonist
VEQDQVFEARLHGEIDVLRAAELDTLSERFASGAAVSAVVDLTEVTFVDSTGLRFIARLCRSCQLRGGHVRLVGASGFNRNLITISRLDRVCDVIDTVSRDSRRSGGRSSDEVGLVDDA